MNNITIEAKPQDDNANTNEEVTMENTTEKTIENTKQPGFLTRIKNAFVAGYRASKAEVKEQVHEIKDTYVSVIEENRNAITKHTRAAIKTAMHITKKTLKGLWNVIAWPFVKIDSIIDPQEVEVTC